MTPTRKRNLSGSRIGPSRSNDNESQDAASTIKQQRKSTSLAYDSIINDQQCSTTAPLPIFGHNVDMTPSSYVTANCRQSAVDLASSVMISGDSEFVIDHNNGERFSVPSMQHRL